MGAVSGSDGDPTAPEVVNVVGGDAHGVTVQAGAIYGGVRIHAGDDGGAPPRQLPMPVGAFVNRAEELAVLTAASPPEGLRPSILAICGGPGTGKTALAVHWAGREGPFPDGELYIDMRAYSPGRPVSTNRALDMFLWSLHVPSDDIPRGIDQRTAMYRSCTAGKRLLVLIDNVAGAAQVRPLLPGSTTCRVVVTSRSTLPGLIVREGAIRLLLGELSVDDSLDVLRAIVGADKVDRDPTAATRLVELCGRLPLALRIVAEREARSVESDLARAAEALADESERLDVLDGPDDELASVRTAFMYSYRRLDSDEARAFRLLGLHPGKTIPVSAVAALIDSGLASVRRVVDRLVTMSLLERVAHERYRLHDLLRLYAAERARIDESPAAQQAALRRLASWYLRNVDAAQCRILPNIGTPVPTGLDAAGPILEFPTVEAAMTWFETERENLVDLTVAAMRAGQHDVAWRLPLSMYGFFELRNHWEQWPEIHRLGIEAAQAAGHRQGLAHNQLGLADALWLGHQEDEALTTYRYAAELAESIGADWVLGFALRQIGTLLCRRDHEREGLQLYRRAIEVFARSGERRGEAMTLLSLAAHDDKAGDVAAAIARCHRALGLTQGTDDRWTVAWVELALGGFLLRSGAAAEALARCQHAAATFAEFGDGIAEAEALLGAAEAIHRLGGRSELEDTLRRIDELLGRRRADTVSDLLARRASFPPVSR